MATEPHFDTMGIPGLLRAARGAYGDVVRAAFAEAGFDDLPRAGAFVLARVFDSTSPLADLTRELRISKQAVSQLIDTMVMRGYLERTADSEDRRRMLITLTARGEEAATVAWKAATSVDTELASRLSPEGIAALRAGLIALAQMSTRTRSVPD